MASLCRIAKSLKTPKFSTQAKSRCRNCGRARAYMRQFQMCRLCFRKYASLGQIPGVTKSSW